MGMDRQETQWARDEESWKQKRVMEERIGLLRRTLADELEWLANPYCLAADRQERIRLVLQKTERG